jgi:hypothetical protein
MQINTLHIIADDYMLNDPFLTLSLSGRFLDAETTSFINMPSATCRARLQTAGRASE